MTMARRGRRCDGDVTSKGRVRTGEAMHLGAGRALVLVGILFPLSAPAGEVQIFVNQDEWLAANNYSIRRIDFYTLPDGTPTQGGERLTPEYNYTLWGVTFLPANDVNSFGIGGNPTSGFDLYASSPYYHAEIVADFVRPTRSVGIFFPGLTTFTAFDEHGNIMAQQWSGGNRFIGFVSDTPIARVTSDGGGSSNSIDAFMFSPGPPPTDSGPAPAPEEGARPLQVYGLSPVMDVAFSPDGGRFLLGTTGGAELHHAAKGRRVRQFGHAIAKLAFSPDGTTMLTASGASATLWDTATGVVLHSLDGHDGSISSVAFSPSGDRVLTGSADGTGKTWDVTTGTIITTCRGHADAVYAAAFSLDGSKVLTGSGDRSAILWNAGSGAELQRFVGHPGPVYSVAFWPDGLRILTGSVNNVSVWHVATGIFLWSNFAHRGAVETVAFSPNGQTFMTAGWDHTVRLWDTFSGEWLLTKPVIDVTGAAFSPDSRRIVSGSSRATAQVWDAHSAANLYTLSGYHSGVTSAAFSPDGSQVLTAGDNESTARLWDTVTGLGLRTFEGDGSDTNSIAFSPDGRKVLMGQDQSASLWNADDGAFVQNYIGHDGSVLAVAYSPDGRQVMTGSADGTARIWDAATGTVMHSLGGPPASITAVAFSPDGANVLTGSGSVTTVKLWDTANGTLQGIFFGDQWMRNSRSVEFSSDGRKVIAVGGCCGSDSGGVAIVWDFSTGLALQVYRDDRFEIGTAVFSPDGTRILTTGEQSTVWDAVTGTAIRSFRGFAGDGAISPDGLSVLTGNRLWDIDGRSDMDGDGHDEINDNCPGLNNADQADMDADAIGDACDALVAAPGDLNCDGFVDVSDLAPFILALLDQPRYTTYFPACDAWLADMNADRRVDGDDVAAIVSRLAAP